MGQALDIFNEFMQNQDASVVADEFKFIGPVDQVSGKDAFLKLSADFFPRVKGMNMLQQFENGDNVCSIYEMDLAMPNGQAVTLTVSDWTIVKDGMLVETRIMYDPREYANALSA